MRKYTSISLKKKKYKRGKYKQTDMHTHAHILFILYVVWLSVTTHLSFDVFIVSKNSKGKSTLEQGKSEASVLFGLETTLWSDSIGCIDSSILSLVVVAAASHVLRCDSNLWKEYRNQKKESSYICILNES